MVNWNAEQDQIILRGIFKFHDIKNSAPLLEYLAEQIGGGCTPKAVSHRLSNLRQTGKPVKDKSVSSQSTPRKKPATAKSPRTPVSGRGRARVPVKKNAELEPDDSDDEFDEELVLSPSVKRSLTRTPNAKTSYAESNATSGDDDEDEKEFVPESKKVKTEPIEEEEGVLSNDDGPNEDEDEGVAFV